MTQTKLDPIERLKWLDWVLRQRFVGASPAEAAFYFRYFLPARALARRTYAEFDPHALQELEGRLLGQGWDKYLIHIRAHLLVAAYHIYELGLDRGPKRALLDIGTGAGYVPYLSARFGHSALAADLNDSVVFNEMIEFLGVDRRTWRVEPFQPAPDFGRRFDLVTGFAVDFDTSGCSGEDRWLRPQWKYFLEDLARNHMDPAGRMVFAIKRFKGGTGASRYDADLFDYFASVGARFPRKSRVCFDSIAGLLR